MEKMSRAELVQMYRPDVERMSLFLPWLENRKGSDVTNMYDGDEQHKTMSIPVYDSVLLEFLNELGNTIFMNQNYRYVYTRYRMKDFIDELKMIEKADIMTMDIICGILSKYTLGGLTKAYLWTQGMENGVFFKAIDKAKSIIEFYDVPIYVPPLEEEEPAEEVMEESNEEVTEAVIEDAVEEVEVAEPVEEVIEEIAEEVVTEETIEEAVEEVEITEPVEEVIEEIAEEEVTEEIIEEAVEEAEVAEPVEVEVAEPVEVEVEVEVAEVVEEIPEEVAEITQALEEVEKLLEQTEEVTE